MTAAVDATAATAADIICSLRAADVAGWTPPWRDYPSPSARGDGGASEQLAWPSVARRKRSPSASSAGSGSTGAKKEKKARPSSRGSPASPLDYSAGSGASTSGAEDCAFCSPPPPVVSSTGGGVLRVEYNSKVAGVAGRRSVVPVPSSRPAGQRPRKKTRLPEVQQMVRSLSVENDALRQEMKTLLKACTAMSEANGKLETRLDQSTKRDGILISEEKKGKPPQPGQRGAGKEAQHGFALPDLNLPALHG